MEYNDVKLLLDKLENLYIYQYICSGKNLQEILEEVKNSFKKEGLDINYLNEKHIEKYIKDTFSCSINPDINQRKNKYWLQNQVNLNEVLSGSSFPDSGSNKKKPDLIKKSLVNKGEHKSNKNAEDLDSINNNILTLFKNVNEIKSEIKKIKGLNNMSSSRKSIKENRQYIDQMLRLVGGDAKTEEVTLNTVLLKDIKDLLIGEYGVQKDISKIINSALILVLYGGNK